MNVERLGKLPTRYYSTKKSKTLGAVWMLTSWGTLSSVGGLGIQIVITLDIRFQSIDSGQLVL